MRSAWRATTLAAMGAALVAPLVAPVSAVGEDATRSVVSIDRAPLDWSVEQPWGEEPLVSWVAGPGVPPVGEGSLRLDGPGTSGLARLSEIPVEDFDTFNVGFTGVEGTQIFLDVTVDVGTDREYVGATFDATGTWQRADLMAVPLTTWTDVGETHYASFASYAAEHPGARVFLTGMGASAVSDGQTVHIDDLNVSSRGMFDGTLTVDFEASRATMSTQVSSEAIELGRGVTVSGQLLDGSGTPVPGERVSLLDSLSAGPYLSRVGVFTTDASGDLATRRFPRRTTTYAMFPEEEFSAVEVFPPVHAVVEVLPNLRAHVVDRRLGRGEQLVVIGHLAGRLGGTTVKLWQAGHRRLLTSTTVGAHGRFTLQATLRIGQHSVWVSTPGGDGLSADRTTSRYVTVRR